jgi:hypothetical protein
LDGEVLTIAASGWTYDEGEYNLFVLQDYETGSLWYHLAGTKALTCIAGPHEGRTLAELGSAYQPWNRWKRSHPNTLVLPTRAGR